MPGNIIYPLQMKLYKFIQLLNPMHKGSKLNSVLRLKCPRCQQGDLFLNRNPYILRDLDKMPDHCPKCGEDFKREVGFYYGAMMVSHATTTLIAVLVHFVVFYFYGWEIALHLISLTIILVGLFPVIFRTSRAIWINMFCSYDPDALK